MKPKEDHQAKGLWSNLKHGKETGGFTWPEIADQMSFYVAGGDLKRLTRALERIVLDRQMTSRCVPALARAWGIPDVVLLHGHFSTCATPEALKEQTGFDADAIVRRWHGNRVGRSKASRTQAFVSWSSDLDRKLTAIITERMKELERKDKAAG